MRAAHKVAHSKRGHVEAASSKQLPPSRALHRPVTLKSWDEQSMQRAVEAVTERRCSIREAALTFQVPKSTLGDRLSGRVQMGAKMGPPTYLTPHEEKELVEFLIGCSRIGFARTRRQVMALVRAAMAKKGREDIPITSGWWDSFMRRHPQVTLRAPEKLVYVRAIMGNKEVIEAYFDLLEETLTKNGLLDKPGAIFNVDETGMPLEHKPEKAVAQKGARNVTAHTSGNKTNITVIACGSAAGQVLPPMVLLQGKKLNHAFTIGEVPGTMYGMGSGWVDTELFEAWFANHFVVYAPKVRPLLLMLDGHASHYQPELVRLAAKESIILFCLPPHCTHLAQPLDKGAFSPLKKYWHQECAKFMENNPGQIVTKMNFSVIFSQAWYRAMTAKTMSASFRATGVYPFNREAIQVAEMAKVCKDIDKGVISYLPLYSPAPKRQRSVPVPRLSFHEEVEKLCNQSLTSPPASPLPAGSEPEFSPEEERLFQTRWENGYDIATDSRYNQWVMTKKESDTEVEKRTESTRATSTTSDHQSALQELLLIPELPSALKKNSEKKFRSARVLTSEAALEQMEERERKKREEEERKVRRREEREKRARQKAEERLSAKKTLEEKQKKERARKGKKAQVPASKGDDTECTLDNCGHPRATKWVCCEDFEGWWHCVCANVSHKCAGRDDFIFHCSNCIK